MPVNISGLEKKIKVEWVNEYPLCPYCEKELDKIEATFKLTLFHSHVLYRCPYCKKLIGAGSDHAMI
jgi:uncharacterized protein with PIN domain